MPSITEELGAHPSWNSFFAPMEDKISNALRTVEEISGEMSPRREEIFAAFSAPIEKARVLIIGQDPYPTAGHAHGIAFSVPSHVQPLPKSLKNIFKEYSSDLGLTEPVYGDLSSWRDQGVILMNRIFTTRTGESNAHIRKGWEEVSTYISQELGQSGAIAILWGNQAQELQRYFTRSLSSPHPSPLSAYKGFFGSKPFSRCNNLLEASSQEPIDWTL
jgi:uracil-DNA glycosylase